MNKIITYAGMAFFALLLFGGAFVGFAKMSGAPMHSLPLVGGLFAEEATEDDSAPVAENGDRQLAKRSVQEEISVGASVLGAFVLPAPYTADQLKDLEMQLKSKLREVQLDLDRLRLRNNALDEREMALQDRWSELQDLRNTLERFEGDLNQRSSEIERDEAARSEKEIAALQNLAKVFEEGDAADLIDKLTAYGEMEAAKLLVQMGVDRAAELLRAMDPETSTKFSRAYTAELMRQD